MKAVGIYLVLGIVVGCSSRAILHPDSSVSIDADAALEGSVEAQKWDDAADDRTGADGTQESTNPDMGGADVSGRLEGYDQWFYPACETADGSCPSGKCFRAQLTVAP